MQKPDTKNLSIRPIWPFLGLLVVSISGCLSVYLFDGNELKNTFGLLEQRFTWLTNVIHEKGKFSLVFLITIPIVFAAEKTIPAKSGQRIFSSSLAQDCLWYFIVRTFQLTVLTSYVFLLESFYEKHLTFMSVRWLDELPEMARLLWGVLLIDFLNWFHHWVRHKVWWLWQFHVIHHSQRNLNLFTDFRYHVLEYIVAETLKIIPLLSLGVEATYIVYVRMFERFLTATYHANIKTDLGPLRYVLVTPQSHRIHHSIEPHHQDKNFGVLLSIWDRLFGTQYAGYEEYPDTGVKDRNFPEDESKFGRNLFVSPFLQHIYPFRVLAKSIGRTKT